MSEKNYYKILGIGNSAPQELIRAAYRTLVGKIRGRTGESENQEKISQITKAYEILGDPRSRASYDKSCDSKGQKKVKNFERRASVRKASSAPVSFCVQHDYRWRSASLRDISMSGLRLTSAEPLIKGQDITVAWTNHTCPSVGGKVKWSRMYHPTFLERIYEAGVEFETPVENIDSKLII